MSDDRPLVYDRESLVHAIESEREYQLRRWGVRQEDGSFKEKTHTVAEFATFVRDYAEEATHQASRLSGDYEVLETLRKVMTLCVACYEQHGIVPRDLQEPFVNGHDKLPA